MKMPEHDYGPIMGSKEDAVKKEYGHRMDVMRANHAKQVKELRGKLKFVENELAKVQSERDKAVNDLDMLVSFGCYPCNFCAKKHDCPENCMRDECKDFQWERVVAKNATTESGVKK